MRSYFLFCLPFLLILTPAGGQAPLSATTKEKRIRFSTKKRGDEGRPAAARGKPAPAKRRTVAAGAVTTGTVKTGTVATRAVPTGGGEKRARALSASKKSVRKKASAAFKPLVVQQTVSHPRNTDQISLIFREERAEYVTNVFLWKSDGPPRLGRFSSLMTKKLHRMKRQAERCHDRLENTVPLLSLIKHPRRRSHDPHAAVLTVGGEAVHEKHPCFKILSRLLQEARQIIKNCIECASYTRKGELIERTVKGIFLLKPIGSKNQIKSGGKALSHEDLLRSQEEVKIFSEKDLDCIPKSDGKKECLDPQFGSFKI